MGNNSIVTNPSSKSTATLIAASGVALAANISRRDGLVQNLGTTKLYVKKGLACSAADFTVILAPGAAEDDGYGGSLPLGTYAGHVSVFGDPAVRCMVSEDIG